MQLRFARQRREGNSPGMSLCHSFLLAVLLALWVQPKISGAQQCAGQDACILPDPRPPPFSLGTANLDEALFELKCELSCISQYAPETEVLDGNSPWPTYNLDFGDNCGLENKVLGCKQGCMEHYMYPDSTVNRCRDSCYHSCMEAEEASREDECPLQCRKTYCRFGCLLYESFTTENVTYLPQAPVDGPEVVATPTTGTCSRSQHDVTFDAPSQTDFISSAYSQQDAVGFLLKVSSQDGSTVRYILQHSLNESLDFASLACQQVSLSYAVVSESTPLSSLVFSPETNVCVPGLDAYPSQVNQSAIQVSFTEDFREGFFGYSVANLSWQRSQEYECVSSYRVNIYPDRLECGGRDQKEQPPVSFINIDKNFTSFAFEAKQDNGFMKFGCSYTFEIEALPVPGVQVGPRITRSADLSNTPSLEVECERIFKSDGHFNVSVTTTLHDMHSTTHIRHFTFSSEVQRDGETIKTVGEETYIPEGNSFEFVKVLSHEFTPLINESQVVKVQITAEKNEEYSWRKVPSAQECFISLDPIPPEDVQEILIENVRYMPSSKRVFFDASWTPPTAYGQLTEYDLVVLSSDDRDMLISGHSIDTLSPYHRETVNPQLREITVNASVSVNTHEHCLYVKMRAKNSYKLYSSWSSAIVLPLDGQCIVQPPSIRPPLSNVSVPIDQEGAMISVYYETDDGNRVRLLDVGCETNPGSSEQNIHNRLEGIEARMDAVLSQLNAEQEAFARLSHLQTKLTDIEQKLDALMNLVTTHVYNT